MKNHILRKYLCFLGVDFVFALIFCITDIWCIQDNDLGKTAVIMIALLVYLIFAFVRGIVTCITTKSVIFPTLILALSILMSEVIFPIAYLLDFLDHYELYRAIGEMFGVGIVAVLCSFISGLITKIVSCFRAKG